MDFITIASHIYKLSQITYYEYCYFPGPAPDPSSPVGYVRCQADLELEQFVNSLPSRVLDLLLAIRSVAHGDFTSRNFPSAVNATYGRSHDRAKAIEEFLDDPPMVGQRLMYGYDLIRRSRDNRALLAGTWRDTRKLIPTAPNRPLAA
jgi:hypothetical protein